MESGRLIEDAPRQGADNMAIDEMLLRQSSMSASPTLRFYFWDRPTVSLGYFQSLNAREAHAPSLTLPLVRRATGGGAIVHHHELTYSLIIPITDRLKNQHLEYYFAVHRGVIATLANFGIEAELAEGTQARQDDPFLCFERRADGDVLIQGHKVLGSAQRRHASALLQHGSLLLQKSSFAPSLCGIQDLSQSPIETEALILELRNGIQASIQDAWNSKPLVQAELEEATEICRLKFGHEAWTAKR
ncbi:MAG: lipoate--protein ligase family protein [Planctomycetota bacterium]|nr:lipoate--protein ligase family protein [Planctomycetota bacterium]